MHRIRDGHRPRAEHLLIHIFLFELLEFVFELVFVDGVADGGGSDGVGDFFAEFVLGLYFLPVVICGQRTFANNIVVDGLDWGGSRTWSGRPCP